MKFLVMWELSVVQVRTEMIHAVMRMPEYAKKLLDQGKLEKRYHVIGKHGGAWIYDQVRCNDTLDELYFVFAYCIIGLGLYLLIAGAYCSRYVQLH